MQYARYNDISKFRAPLKYGVYSGFGAETSAPIAPATPLEPSPADLMKAFTDQSGGATVFKPQVADSVLRSLVGFLLIPNASDTGGFLQLIDASTPPENVIKLGAAAWVDKKLKAGKSVIGTLSVAVPLNITKGLAAVDPSQEAAATKAGTGFAVLRSGPKGLFATLGPTGVVVGVLVGAGIIYAVTRKRKG